MGATVLTVTANDRDIMWQILGDCFDATLLGESV